MKNKKFLPIVFAILFLVIAIVFLIDLIGWIQTDTVVGQFWPALFILIGIISITPKNESGNSFSFFMVGIGTLFLLKNMGVFESPAGQTVLVVLLALCGLAVLAFATAKKDS